MSRARAFDRRPPSKGIHQRIAHGFLDGAATDGAVDSGENSATFAERSLRQSQAAEILFSDGCWLKGSSRDSAKGRTTVSRVPLGSDLMVM